MNPRSSFGGWVRFAQTVQGSAGSGLGWAESLNFVGPRVRVSFWSWALLALGAIAVVHALELARQVDAAGQAAHAELERLQRHAQSSGAPALPVTGASVASGAFVAAAADAGASSADEAAPSLQDEGWRSAAQLAAWLGHPWAPVLDQADASAHQRGIALMRFQLDLGSWGTRAAQPLSWRLQAAVPDDATALAWLQDLGADAQLLRRDALAQAVSSERGTLAWRIDVSAAGGQP